MTNPVTHNNGPGTNGLTALPAIMRDVALHYTEMQQHNDIVKKWAASVNVKITTLEETDELEKVARGSLAENIATCTAALAKLSERLAHIEEILVQQENERKPDAATMVALQDWAEGRAGLNATAKRLGIHHATVKAWAAKYLKEG